MLSILIAGDVDAQGDARGPPVGGVDGKFPLVVAAACAIIASKLLERQSQQQPERRTPSWPRRGGGARSTTSIGRARCGAHATRRAARGVGAEGPDENSDASEADAACGAAFAAVLDASPACRKRARTDGCSIERRLVALANAAELCTSGGHAESHPVQTVDQKSCRTVAAHARVVAASLRRGARDDEDFREMNLAALASTLRKAWPFVKAASTLEDETGGPGGDALDALNRCALALANAGDEGCVAVAASDSSKKVRRAACDHSLARCLMDSAVRGELAISPAAARDADATALVVSKRCAVACAALAKLAQAPCRGAVIQGGFVRFCGGLAAGGRSSMRRPRAFLTLYDRPETRAPAPGDLGQCDDVS